MPCREHGLRMRLPGCGPGMGPHVPFAIQALSAGQPPLTSRVSRAGIFTSWWPASSFSSSS